MALRDTWVDKVNNVDTVDANDINMLASAIINVENTLGDVDTALDTIISIQYELIGGDNT